jgi:hypothetical protein
MEKRIIPKFATEAEEADWWFDHREETARAMVEAFQQGRNGIGTLGRARLRAEAQAEAEAQALQSTNSRAA